MTKMISVAASLVLAASSLLAVEIVHPEQIMEKVAALPVAQKHRFKPEAVKDAGALYMVKGHFETPEGSMSATMYVSEDYSTVMYGRAFDAASTAVYVTVDQADLKRATALSIGQGPEEIYIVSDPLCPYCKTLERELERYGEVATFHIIFVALPMHPDAKQAIKHILKSEDPAKEVLAIAADDKAYLGSTFTDKADAHFERQILRMKKMADELGVRGTPSLFSVTGEPLPRNVFSALDAKLAAKKVEKKAIDTKAVAVK